VADNNNGRLAKLSHDGRRLLQMTLNQVNITGIAVNKIRQVMWVIDRQFQEGWVARLSLAGEYIEPAFRFTQPVDIDVLQQTGDLWVADRAAGLVRRYNPEGFQADEYSVAVPSVVSVDQRNGICWSINSQTNRVIRINPLDDRIRTSGVQFNELRTLDVDSRDGSVWVLESQRAVKISENGMFMSATSAVFQNATKLVVNRNNGEFWVIDRGENTVSKFDQNGNLSFKLGGYAEPEDLAINLSNDGCLVADTGNNRVVRISSVGKVYGGYSVDNPAAIAVEY
jgi:DNA-binding beta-propeller fold protein YncE